VPGIEEMKLLGLTSVGLGVADQLLIRFPALVRHWRRNENTMRQLFMDFKKAYDSVRRKVLYNILIEFGVPLKLVRLKRV
jgi:hypothetical protein